MERLVYRVERNFSRHGWLVQCLLLVLFGGVILVISGLCFALVWNFDKQNDTRAEEDVSAIVEGIWEAWTFMADGGTHAPKLDPAQRIVSAVITILGIIYMGVVLAVIVDLVRSRIDAMKRGRTMVFEANHTLVVNWTDKTIPVIQELCNANKSEGGGVVVVLSTENREQMELDLMLQLPVSLRYGTQIICRNGSPLSVSDLYKVSAHFAKATVILADGATADEADSSTLRTVLSLKSMGLPLSGHIVAELRDIDNEPLLKLVGGSIVESLVSHDVLGRLMIMAVRQPGLARVYEAVLGFEGHEFYMREWPELVGVRFGDLQVRFPDAIPLGVCRCDGQLMLNPDPGREFEEGDKLIVLAEDDDTYRPEPAVNIEIGFPPPMSVRPSLNEKAFVCGWRRDIRDILVLLDSVMKEGSEVHMMSHCIPIDQRDLQLLEEGLDVRSLTNIRLIHHGGNTSVRKRLEVLPIEKFTSCMIFADQAYEQDTMHSDSHSLATLLLIRDIESTRVRKSTVHNAEHPTPIICEVLDSRTQRTIAGHSGLSLASDFVQSNKLIAQIMAMVAETRSVKVILDELLGIDGASLLVVPPHWYCHKEEEVSFLVIAQRAALQQAILIGYQVRGSTEGTVLNPPDKDVPRSWDGLDLAIISGNHSFTSLPTRYSTAPVALAQNRPSHRAKDPGPQRTAGGGPLPHRHSIAEGAEGPAPAARFTAPLEADRSSREAGVFFDTSVEGKVSGEPGTPKTPVAPDEPSHPEDAPTADEPLPRPLITAMTDFRRLCQGMPEEERRRFGAALAALGNAAVDGSIFADSRRPLSFQPGDRRPSGGSQGGPGEGLRGAAPSSAPGAAPSARRSKGWA